jgi:hypothetical protein
MEDFKDLFALANCNVYFGHKNALCSEKTGQKKEIREEKEEMEHWKKEETNTNHQRTKKMIKEKIKEINKKDRNTIKKNNQRIELIYRMSSQQDPEILRPRHSLSPDLLKCLKFLLLGTFKRHKN